MTKYRLYIDEVGNPDLEHSADPNHRFLSLTGVIAGLDDVRMRIHPEMEALKIKYFGSHPDDPIILHRKEIVNRSYPFQVLRNQSIEATFNEDLLMLLRKWDYRVITICLDKMKHQETYKTWRYDPYHYCLAILMERFTFWLNRQRAQGDVMSESRGGKEDMRLKGSFLRLLERGTDFVGPEQFKNALTSQHLKVRPKSANVAGLQLTDLIAHPSRSEILSEQGLLGRPLAPFAQRIVELLRDKYDQEGGRVYGRKFV
jgi:hypothetical protein